MSTIISKAYFRAATEITEQECIISDVKYVNEAHHKLFNFIKEGVTNLHTRHTKQSAVMITLSQDEYWDSNPDPNRMFFVKGMPPYGEKRTHHVHIFEYNSDHWCNKLIFRNYLRSHADVAKEYEQLKAKLAQEHLYDREKYTDEKLDFVNRVLRLARM